MKFQDDISNMNTHTHTHTNTHTHTDKPKPICPPLFQSWGHNNYEEAKSRTRQIQCVALRMEIPGLSNNTMKF